MNRATFGFRVLGSPFEERRLVDWQKAFQAYCSCDERAEVNKEAYLSAFTFGADFRDHLEKNRSTKGYIGLCGSRYLWFDIDRDGNVEAATRDVRRLVLILTHRYGLEGEELLLFFSGSKGFHVGLPFTLCGSPEPSVTFNAITRRLAAGLAIRSGLDPENGGVDVAVYDKVRLFRAPNSRHPKTGLYKRRLTCDEVLNLSSADVLRLAAEPQPFDIPAMPPPNQQAVNDWQAATQEIELADAACVQRQAKVKGRHGTTAEQPRRLNRSTLDFIRDGAHVGDRHRLLFSAAANLAELDCPAVLAHELLTEAALDSGLPPNDVRRQIDCGLEHGRRTE